MSFRDHFSNHAVHYEAYRPTYPDDLFAYLARLSPSRTLALDCATGNGQAAIGLIPHFRSVVALDASRKQLDLASIRERITYVQALADQTPLPTASVDLLTVATAFHWLNYARFYDEVRRVAKPDGILAVWGYKLPTVSNDVDAVVERLSVQILARFWLPETKMAAEGYQTVSFPFDEITTPPFRMVHELYLDQFMGFLGTWSASLRYRSQIGRDPIDEIREELTAAWGNTERQRQVAWDLSLRAGRIHRE
jgi:ubiquinone/menaquinone biosynthesis C-methylase UbiE